MGDQDRTNQHPSGSKKNSLDDIISHMTADLQSYEGQYILLGSPQNSQHVWSKYTPQTGQPMTVHSPIFVQQPFDMHERKVQEYPPQHGLFYPNPPPAPEATGEMIGMMDVGGGNFVNVVFSTSNPPTAIHPFIPAHPPESNMGYLHYQQQQQLQTPSTHMSNSSSGQGDYGLFKTEPVNQNNHQLIENVVGNWLPNKSGTYSPFGGITNTPNEVVDDDTRMNRHGQLGQVKKPRIVAEVRPMRPSYSDVLAKSAPPLTPPLSSTKPTLFSGSVKNESKKQNIKGSKGGSNGGGSKSINPTVKRHNSNNGEEQTKASVKKWISLDDLTPPQSSEESSFIDYEAYLDDNTGNASDNFILINGGEIKREKKQKKKTKPPEDKCEALNNHKTAGINGNSKRPLHINNNLQGKTTSPEKNVTKSTKNTRSQDDGKKGLGNGSLYSGASSKTNVSSEERVPSVSRVSRSAGSNNSKRSHRSTKRKDGQNYLNALCKRWQEQMSYYGLMFLTWFFHLIWDVMAMSARLLIHLFGVMAETGIAWLSWLQCRASRLVGRDPWWNFWNKKPPPPPKPSEPTIPGGLTCNISLPATGDEAMKRLLACKGKDPYSILGVTNDCTDDDIKKYYKRQAVLVHPDKNSQPGAEEAFKILVHAFELIGEPERRSAYNRCVAETHQVEQAWSELSELLSQLHHKMEYAANTIRCTNCGKRHKRTIMQRPCYAARFCAQCKIHHSAREGDIWAESWMLGFLWHYYACMEGAVYDITEWAACQADNLKHLKANSHAVQYRIVLGKQTHNQRSKESYNEPDFEEFLNTLYAQSGTSSGDGGLGGNENSSRQRRKNKRKK